MMREENPVEAPSTDLRRGGVNRVVLVFFWLFFGLVFLSPFAMNSGQDPFSVAITFAYGFVWFALGFSFAKLSRVWAL